ncbi:WD repeat-containing protein 11 [Pelomyxa schiedti]|nr:WD repeat-containing protein 11 [Pelomyxa schiedti]
MPVLPKIIPGPLHATNRGAIDWAYGLVAYGCHSYVVIVSPASLEVAQTLDGHSAYVSCVKWTKMSHGGLPGREPVLASGDKAGSILIWNICDASVMNTLRVEHCGVDQLQWHPENSDMLVSIHHPAASQQASIILWNAKEGNQVWKVNLPEVQYSLSLVFSPFDLSTLAFASHPGAIYFIYDFNLQTPPAKVDQKYRVAGTKHPESKGKKSLEERHPDLLQMMFSPHTLNLVYVLSPREISIFDIYLNKPIGVFGIDSQKEDFQAMLLCKDHPDILLCLHVDGSVSVWNRKTGLYDYELSCWADVLQFSRKSQKKNAAICSLINGPVNELRLTAVSIDGAVWVWDYDEFVTPIIERTTLTGAVKRQRGRLSVAGMVPSLACPATSVVISPFHTGLAALTTRGSVLQIVDVERSRIQHEFSVWSHKEKITPINGVVWLDPNQVMVFGSEPMDLKRDSKKFINKVAILNIMSGVGKDIRPTQPELTSIRGIKVSHSRQYFLILFKDGHLEVWQTATLSIIKTMKIESQVNCAEWIPNKPAFPVGPQPLRRTTSSSSLFHDEEIQSLPESFLLSLASEAVPLDLVTRNTGNGWRCFSVTPDTVKPTALPLDLGQTQPTCMAMKDHFIATADSSGFLHMWNTETTESKSVQTHQGTSHQVITRIQFLPTGNSQYILVSFSAGILGIWDLETGSRVALSSYLSQRNLSAMDISWLGGCPIAVASDNSIRVLDKLITTTNNRVQLDALDQTLLTVYLQPPQRAALIHTMLAHLTPDCVFGEKRTFLHRFVDEDVLNELERAPDLLSRCLITAKYFEAVHELRFWSLTNFAIHRLEKLNRVKASTPVEESHEPVEALTPARSRRTADVPLNGFYELLSNAPQLIDREYERSAIHGKRLAKDAPEDQYKKLANFNILLGKRHEAADLLLSSLGNKEINYQALLKACIVAGSLGTDSFVSTVQMVATNFISRGNVTEGIELLCIINKASDACKYLLSVHKWTDAVWLANLRLDTADSAEVLLSWVSFLATSGQIMKALEVLVCLGEFHHVLQLLVHQKSWETAALFARCCSEHNLLVPTTTEISTRPSHTATNITPLPELLRLVYLNYSQYLSSGTSLESASVWYSEHSVKSSSS